MVRFMSSYHKRVGNGHFGIELFGRWFIGVYYYGWPQWSEIYLDLIRVAKANPGGGR